MTALAELASNTSQIFRISCRFRPNQPIAVSDVAATTHLYRIAQEAISNAVRHGAATEVAISLARDRTDAILSITDNGSGFVEPKEDRPGMGLHIMKYRAGMIGGSLEIHSVNGSGVVVSCRFRPALSSFP
jgi:signal transduction histidine kinase